MKKVIYIKCLKCQTEISSQNFKRHINRCDGSGIIKNKIRNKGQGNNGMKGKTYIEIYGEKRAKEILEKLSEIGKRTIKRKLTLEEEKLRRGKISNSLKLAYIEGRAFGWQHQHSKEFSYPEQFVFDVLKNNGITEKYKVEKQFQFGKYTLDFVIVDIKLNIEVDGDHHYRTQEAIDKDKIRNQYLIDKGWKVYRICWKQMYNNTKNEIEQLLNFINDIDNQKIRTYNIEDISLNKKHKRDYELIKNENERMSLARKELILNSNIDFSKFGCIEKISKLLKLSHTQTSRWIKKYMPDFYKKCYKNKTNK